MKYLLFDLTVLTLFIAIAAWELLGVRKSPLVLECDATYDDTNQTSIRRQRPYISNCANNNVTFLQIFYLERRYKYL